ncbi:MAG: ribosome biogenesis GTP-binding protein YihA/YsxC [Gammaproteobacteria bacterium]|nr:ribosome biogenesis GTP-binding protein YihA/YsxC [Gammaproteobacteria bacterium]
MTDQHIKFRSAEFTTSASKVNECPEDIGAEVAFAGRSNAGKSSAINALTRNPRLARTSKTPGRTQLLNFFNLNIEQCRLVDLPGYGYAKVPLAMQLRWRKHLNQYLEVRESLAGLVLVMDIRHPLKEFDLMIITWCIASELPLHLLLTKADKLKKNGILKTKMEVKKNLPEHPEGLITMQSFSASKGEGIPDLERQLVHWMKPVVDAGEEVNSSE